MPIDLGVLGIFLTFLSPGLFTFLRGIFSEVEPKDAYATLVFQADNLKILLESMVFQHIEDDIQRLILTYENGKKQQEEYLTSKRKYVASDITKRIWNQTIKFQEIKNIYVSWNQIYCHGRLIANVCIMMYFILFAILTILAFSNVIPQNIGNKYYWLVFAIIFIPCAYIFLCWMVAYFKKNKFESLSKELSFFVEV
jgi:hypothetical protein